MRTTWSVVFLLSPLLLFHTLASHVQHLCRVDQMNTLLDFKNEFNGDMCTMPDPDLYPETRSWNMSSDCCYYWDGVTCDAQLGVVIGLDLSRGCLIGPLLSNSSLFRLHHLQSLNLIRNDFEKSLFPAEFGKLSRLTRLLISSELSGRIPIELLRLTKLVYLKIYEEDVFIEKHFFRGLAKKLVNLRELHLEGIDISSAVPKTFVNLTSLRALHLVRCNLLGEFPSGVFSLPNVQSISLSNNFDLHVSLPEFQANSSLTMLDLSSTKFSGALPDSIGNLKSLECLDLSTCGVSGRIPPSLGNLSYLTYLDLSNNNFNGQVLPWIGNFTKINTLALSASGFVGEVPYAISNLTRLTDLRLSNNKLTGSFPSVFNLTKLPELDIRGNHFTGPIPSDISHLSNLRSLVATDNKFSGTIPTSLLMMPSLSEIDLSSNQLSGFAENGNVSSLSQLTKLRFGHNNFDTAIPTYFSKLINLVYLEMPYLNTSSAIDFNVFMPLKSLVALEISGNKVSMANVCSTSHAPLMLNSLYMSGCDIDEFPHFLKTQMELSSLDLSNNRITGQVPVWLWSLPNLEEVVLSHNSFEGFEGSADALVGAQIRSLDLRSNSFTGSFPVPPPRTLNLLASNNNFTGEILPSICKLDSLDILDLSNNSFGGLIPHCLHQLSSYLSVLNLRRNNFNGSLPDTFLNGSSLRTLDLGHNGFTGKLPRSLLNCTGLEVLNVESNKIDDTFPFWLEALPELQVLVLRANRFHGPISSLDSPVFTELRIIDISSNNLTGELPPDYFVSWRAMAMADEDFGSQPSYMGDMHGYYQDFITVMSKGQTMELVKILTIFTTIDFSGNRFGGQIPKSVGLLKELIVINLSENDFTGHIPPCFANLTALESLDLSRNRLSGELRPELGALTFLEYINFSHNQLVGLIPQGTQFQGQPRSSFEGNVGLYGPPLEESCVGTSTLTSQERQQHQQEEVLSKRAVAIGYACGTVFGLMVGHALTRYKRQWFVKIYGRNM